MQDMADAAAAWHKAPHTLTLPERWILSRHNRLIHETTTLVERFQFGEAGRQIYEFLWGEFCDWFIEISKVPLYGEDEQAAQRARAVLVYVLERTLRLLHPFMPFVTEETWQHLPHEGEALIIAPWPRPDPLDEDAEAEMGPIMEMVRAIRNARSEYEVEPSREIEAIIVAADRADLVLAHADILTRLARVDAKKLRIEKQLADKPGRTLALMVGGYELFLPLAGLVDIDRERARRAEELRKLEQELARSQQLLANPSFLSKAPPDVVSKERAKLEDQSLRREKLQARLKSLEE
jgi:valyl-tRNA synthetase